MAPNTHFALYLTGALAMGCSGSTGESADAGSRSEPREVELVFQWDDESQAGIQLANAALTTPEEGDFALRQAMVLSLYADDDVFCHKGTFESLSDVPTTEDDCPLAPSETGNEWRSVLYLSASTIHSLDESYVIGTGALFRASPGAPLYRLRVLGDSYSEEGVSTALIEYERVSE